MARMSEVYGAVRELAELAKLDKPSKDAIAEAYSLMGKLQGFGFSGAEVSKLVKGRWKASTIKAHRIGSGAVHVSGRDELLRIVAEFAAMGVDLAEVEEFRAAKKTLGDVGMNFAGAEGLARGLPGRAGAGKIEKLGGELAKADSKIAEISERLSLEGELKERGLTMEFQLKLLKAMKEFGSPEELLEGLEMFRGILGIKSGAEHLDRGASALQVRVSELRAERDKLDEQCSLKASEIGAVNALWAAGFDLDSVKMLREETGDLGGPYGVIVAIARFKSLKQLEAEIESRKKELEKIKREIGNRS